MADRSDTLVGRERELDVLRAAVDEARGGARVVVLQGEAGIGKTTLWEAGVAVAATQGARVLRTRAAQSRSPLRC